MFGFGGGGRGRNERPTGMSVTLDLEVSLKDLYLGKDMDVVMTKQMVCSHCRGTGAEDPDDVGEPSLRLVETGVGTNVTGRKVP